MPIAPPFSLGQLVKFVDPKNDDERAETFHVLEVRGDRVLVEFVCDMSIRPTFVYPTADLKPVGVSLEAGVTESGACASPSSGRGWPV